MNRKRIVLFHLFICFFLLVPALPGYCQEKPSCAVLMLHADEASSDIYGFESRALTSNFSQELKKFGTYDVLDTDEMVKMLSGNAVGGEVKTCKLKGCAVREGKKLNVDYVIYGVFGHIGGMYSIETNLVEVKTGKLVRQVTTDYEGDRVGFAAKVPLENLKSLLGISELPSTTKTAIAKKEKAPVSTPLEEGTAEEKKFHFGPRIGIGASDDGVQFGGGLEFRFSNLAIAILGNDAGVGGGLSYYLHPTGNSPYLSITGLYYDTKNHGVDERGTIYGGVAGYRIMIGEGLDLNLGIGAGYADWHQYDTKKPKKDTQVIPIGELTLGYMF
jgi:hypothetical protein